MSALARELLTGIIDYAGLFPPAKLTMAEAVAAYRRYRKGSESWIIDKFLCPAGRLAELCPQLQGDGGDIFNVGVIGSGGADLDAFQTGLENDADSMSRFEDECEADARLGAYEARLPVGVSVEAAANDLRAFDRLDVFLELPWGTAQSDQLAAIAAQDWLGAKARTGGLEASEFPDSRGLAQFLKGCQDTDIRFKLTAGLHRPLYHFDPEIGAHPHGFLNVLAALALNDANDLSTGEMARVLEAGDIVWSDERVSWQGMNASRQDCSEVRTLFSGFGSCSVDEPLEGLVSLGLLEGARV